MPTQYILPVQERKTRLDETFDPKGFIRKTMYTNPKKTIKLNSNSNIQAHHCKKKKKTNSFLASLRIK